jgi:hypothetical protein
MGIDNNADIGYGFLLDKKTAEKVSDGSLTLDKEFAVKWSGDAYADRMQTFAFISDSVQDTWAQAEHKAPLKRGALDIQPGWNVRLEELAKKLGVKRPKIGWWLLSSVS